jgi:hypothetical protein
MTLTVPAAPVPVPGRDRKAVTDTPRMIRCTVS